MIKIDMVFLSLFAAIITADNTKKEPKLAAIGKDQFEIEDDNKKPPKTEEPKIKIATPKLAPEEIPRTNGPAKGFLKSVCINNPQTDKPEPTKIAVIALGILKFTIMISQLSFEMSPPKRRLNNSLNGIATEPKLIFIKNKMNSKTDKKIKCIVNFFCSIMSYLF